MLRLIFFAVMLICTGSFAAKAAPKAAKVAAEGAEFKDSRARRCFTSCTRFSTVARSCWRTFSKSQLGRRFRAG